MRPGAHGLACTRPPTDLTLDSLMRHQEVRSADDAALDGGLSLGGAPRPKTTFQPLTSLRLPARHVFGPNALPRLSVRQAIDRHSSAPCLMRVVAKPCCAFPLDPTLWTAPDESSAAAGGFAYRMVLQLGDTGDDKIFIGAVLSGEHAQAFFPGLPPVDLRNANASLMALRARMEQLTADDAPPAEFVLWACRPPKDTGANGAGANGVAHHIVATECLLTS